ncbi:MAG TPA: MMPL family transporter [Solirubrobacteraceae bacterium]|nr:MMPL family transporter [Solirubrobacteraceae bacterium]
MAVAAAARFAAVAVAAAARFAAVAVAAAARFAAVAVAAAARFPAAALAAVCALALAGGLVALRLAPSTGLDTFLGRSAPAWRATEAQQRLFGADPIVVLVRAPAESLLQPSSLATLSRLEACLAGQYVAFDAALGAYLPVARAPSGALAAPCAALHRARAVVSVYGPATFLNRTIAALNEGLRDLLAGVQRAAAVAERSALRLALARGLSRRRALDEAAAAGLAERLGQLAALERLAASIGTGGVPSIRNVAFVRRLVLGSPAAAASAPSSRLAYLFPNAGTGLIQVRLRSSLGATQRSRAIGLIMSALAKPSMRPAGSSYTVAGEQIVLDDLTGELSRSISRLLIAAVLAIGLALLAIFRAPWRLLPLAVALAAAAITFGLLSLAGWQLTIASIAVLPILIGLAVDYTVQLQARAVEWMQPTSGAAKRATGAALAAAQHGRDGLGDQRPAAGVGRAARSVAAAAVATGAGLLVLLLSPVPMVRGFGVLLAAGIAVGFACAMVAVPAALAMAAPARTRPAPAQRGAGGLLLGWVRGAGGRLLGCVRGAGELLCASVRGAGELLAIAARPLRVRRPRALAGAGRPVDQLRGVGAGALRLTIAHPGRLLAAGGLLAALGWALGGSAPVQTDVTRLAGTGNPAVRTLRALERVSGASGEIDVLVRSANVTSPGVVAWMSAYQSAVLRHVGYSAARGCAGAALCPAPSLAALLTGAGATTPSRIDALLAAIPPYFTRALVTPDRRAATIVFGVRLMPLAREQRLIAYMRSRLRPPVGVSAALAGLPVVAAQAAATLASPGRRWLDLAVALVAVAAVLVLVLGSVRRALAPLVPIVLATGLSSLVVGLLGVALNPISVTLSTLVIAICTEFSVLLAERHRQERRAGHDLRGALILTYRTTGASVLVSGLTALAGFAVLVTSPVPILRNFGLVTLVDLSVSLAAVMVVLPATLAALDRFGDPRRSPLAPLARRATPARGTVA